MTAVRAGIGGACEADENIGSRVNKIASLNTFFSLFKSTFCSFIERHMIEIF